MLLSVAATTAALPLGLLSLRWLQRMCPLSGTCLVTLVEYLENREVKVHRHK